MDGKEQPRVKIVRRIRYKDDVLGWRGDSHSHIFVIPICGGEARQLTDGDCDDFCPTWSPDGEHIAFISGRGPDMDIRLYTEAYVTSADGGQVQRRSDGLYSIGGLGWSPDGTRLVVAASDDPRGMAWIQSWLFVLEPDETPRRITNDSIKPAASNFPILPIPWPIIRWTEDDRILFLGDARGQSYICETSATGGETHRLTGGGYQAASLSLDESANLAVIAGTPPNSPSELYLLDLGAGKTKRLTRSSRYLSNHPPALMEKFTFTRKEREIECRLWLPPDFDPERRYPLVLDIHGGPNSAFYDAFNIVQQTLATSGYAVLAVNPTGSTTYGNDFTMAVLGDWCGQDYYELMEAVDLVSSRPYIDESRLGVYGYSYGGFMASWIVGHTDRFKAAIVGAPCIDLPSMYGTSDIGVSFGEPQWGDSHTALVERSPLTYASNVNTPVLLLHGEADARCPIEQSEQFFVALKRQGKEVEFVRFPDSSHAFPRSGHPKMREEFLRRVLDWFNSYL